MTVEKEIHTVEKMVYTTSDGQKFEREDKADMHEHYLMYKERVDALKRIDGAYYCETQEDFNNIVEMKAYRKAYYDITKSVYVPSYDYSKTYFNGPDWYFFDWEYDDNGPDCYWVESLSEKKAEWDKFYGQFESPEKEER